MHWDDPEGWDGEGGGRGGSGWGTHVNPWLIHVNVWQKPLQYCKVISLQLIKIIGKKKKHGGGSIPKKWPSLEITAVEFLIYNLANPLPADLLNYCCKPQNNNLGAPILKTWGHLKAINRGKSRIMVADHCSVAQSCLTLCNPMDSSMPGFPVLHHLVNFLKGQQWDDLSFQDTALKKYLR